MLPTRSLTPTRSSPKAESVLLYSVAMIDPLRQKRLVTKLEESAATLERFGNFDFTVRQFRHTARQLATPAQPEDSR